MPIVAKFVLASGGGSSEFGLVLPVQWETLLWSWGIFLILFLILRKFAWKPLLAAVEAREKRIADSLARAEEIQRSAAEIAARQEAALAEAQTKSKAVLDEARAQAEEFRKRETEKARTEASAFLDRAKKEIALEESRVRDAIRRDTVDIAIEVASKVLERAVNTDDDRKLADRLVGEVQARRVGAKRN